MSSSQKLKLAVVSHSDPSTVLERYSYQLSANENITIGRNSSNHLPLIDPLRVISRVQASVSLKDNVSAWITNVSSSTSIFINEDEVKPGDSLVFSCDDSLLVGDYLLKLSQCDYADIDDLSMHVNVAEADIFIPEEMDFCLAGDQIENNFFEGKSVADIDISLSGKTVSESVILEHLLADNVANADLSSGLLGHAQYDSLPEINSLFIPPRSTRLQKNNHTRDSDFPFSGDLLPDGIRSEDDITLECRQAFSRALGIDMQKMPAFTPAFYERLGSILLLLTAGTVSMVHERAKIKHEMRADVTIIAASGNNPLKFAPDAQSAITHMLADNMPGFMCAKDAINDVFDDLLAHQIGLLSGARESVYDVVKNFSPERIQKYIAKKNIVDALVPMSKKAKLWELYEVHYAEVAGDAREEFELRFQQAFAQAYELAIDSICEARGAV